MAGENLLKMAEQKFQSAAEKIAKDLIATCYKEPQTNADRIRTMSDEELAKFIVDEMCIYCQTYRTEECYKKCVSAQIEWLKQPAE